MKKLPFFLAISFIMFYGNIIAQTISLDQGKITAIETLVEKTLLKFDYSLEKAWVSPSVWDQYNIDGKKSFTILCAMYVKHRNRDKSDKHPVIDIYDYKNGKYIASFGPIGGFRVFN
ncbi:MAG: hypothetical protein WD426_09145 [Anditalea sp.]